LKRLDIFKREGGSLLGNQNNEEDTRLLGNTDIMQGGQLVSTADPSQIHAFLTECLYLYE